LVIFFPTPTPTPIEKSEINFHKNIDYLLVNQLNSYLNVKKNFCSPVLVNELNEFIITADTVGGH